MRYVPPLPATCPCGTEVIYGFGKFDATDYRDGILTRHVCKFDDLDTAPVNEKGWPAMQEQLRRLFDASYRSVEEQVEPAPPPPAPREKPKERGGSIGLD